MQEFQEPTPRLGSPPELLADIDIPWHVHGLEGLKTALNHNPGNSAELGWQQAIVRSRGTWPGLDILLHQLL